MTDRSVVVRLKADTSNYTAKMVAAGKTAESAFLSSSKAAEKNRKALTTVGNAAGIMGAAAAAAVGIAVKSAADFDQSMSNVQAATHASAGVMGQFRQAAIKAGADTQYSATEAAGAIENLSKAGVSAKDILGGGLRGALNLAAAGQIDVGDAAEYTATALTQFQLKGDKASHVADLLAAGAGKAQGEVSDMALALKYAGVPADNLGVSIEQTAGTIALFAKNGIIGEQAGTTLRGMLSSLTSPSSAAANKMQELGINVSDAHGNFVGLDGVAAQLHDRLSGLTQVERAQALGVIFGNEQLQGANVLYREGAKGVDEWTRKVNDQGYAAETAATKMDNLKGDLEQLRGSLETLFIGVGEGAQSPMRGTVQSITSVVNALNEIPQPAKTAGLALGAITAVAGGTAFLGSRFITSITEARTALNQLTGSAEKTKSMLGKAAVRGGAGMLGGAILAFNDLDDSANRSTHALGQFANVAGSAMLGFSVGGPWGAAIGGAVGLVMQFAGSHKIAAEDVDALTDTLNTQTGAITQNTREWAAKKLEDEGVLKNAASLGLNLKQVTDAALGQGDALGRVASQLRAVINAGSTDSAYGTTHTQAAQQAQALLDVIMKTNGALDASRAKWKRHAAAMGESADETKRNSETNGDLAHLLGGPLPDGVDKTTGKMDDGADSAKSYADRVKDLDERLKDLQATLDKRSTWRDYQAAIDDATDSIKENGRTTAANTEKGRNNADALDQIAANALEVAKNMDAYQKKQAFLAKARKTYIDTAEAMGMNRQAAIKLANSIFGIPEKRTTKPEFDKRNADRDVDDYKKNLDSIPTDPTTKPKLDDGKARSDTNAFVSFFDNALGGIRDEQVNVQLSGLAKLALSGQGPLRGMGPGMAEGGPVPLHMGQRGKDSVPAVLMPGEHVITADEVRKAGGQQVIYWLRQMIRDGSFKKRGDIGLRYADGGAVSPRVSNHGFGQAINVIEAAFGGVVDRIGENLSDRINKMYQFGGGKPLGPGGTLSAGQIMMGQRFAQAQNGKPYIWGGVGPAGYDCSGFQSAILNAAMGRTPYSRIGSTSTMPWPGMASGVGRYTIGWFTGNPGHTSGNIGGLGVESTDGSVRVGSAARSPLESMFNHVGHYDSGGPLYPGWTAAFNGTGSTEHVVKGYAKGGEVTPEERKQRRQDRREKAKEDAKEAKQLAREQANALTSGLRQFNITPHMGRNDVMSELQEFRSTIREAFGKDSHLLDAFGKLDERFSRLAKTHDKLIRSQEKLNEHLDNLRQQRNQYAQSVAGNFRNDIFGGGLGDLSLQLRADTNDARRSRNALRQAAHKGLSGGLYASLAASGNVLLEQQFADLSRKQIRRYERMYASRQGASAALGRMAGGEVYGDRIHENSRELRKTNQHLAHNTRATRKLTRTLEKRVRGASGAHKRVRGGR